VDTNGTSESRLADLGLELPRAPGQLGTSCFWNASTRPLLWREGVEPEHRFWARDLPSRHWVERWSGDTAERQLSGGKPTSVTGAFRSHR